MGWFEDLTGLITKPVSSVINTVASMVEGDSNRKQQQANLDYQKHLNQMTMDREDNAIQRRVADLKAAGLSKTLAAGSPASSATFRSGETPQSDIMGKVMQAKQLEIANNSIAQTKAQTELLKAQKNKTDIEAGLGGFELDSLTNSGYSSKGFNLGQVINNLSWRNKKTGRAIEIPKQNKSNKTFKGVGINWNQ